MIEIERKFLVLSDRYRVEASKKSTIAQGYLNSHPERSVRIRLNDQKGSMTVKGKSNQSGLSRFEWEKEIDILEAEALLLLCEPSIIEKTRFYVKCEQHVFEIDAFFGDNLGLIVAEIELEDEAEAFQKPIWIGEEVTGNEKYYNSKLSKVPFKDWV
jgi:adenylate cyclase